MLYYVRSPLFASFLYFGRRGMTEAQARFFKMDVDGADGGGGGTGD